MTTFIIYVRYHELRTLPGLMLMNLIVALFFAQLLFVMNAWSLFETDPIMCLIMATAQHYLWLASFTWMGCMSLDIFRCLSHAGTSVNTYSTPKYFKYLPVGWGLPIPFPLIANVLTISTSSYLTYSTSGSCWMANSKGVLYLFAMPVFVVVGTNVILFIGSVCRLCNFMKNASFVGRKEDNKQHLAQCIKLSSWMGISWLFGIIPNFVGIDALWYAFVTANALQGVHIFFAFGFTGRAGALIKGNQSGNKTSAKISSTVQVVMANWWDLKQCRKYEVKTILPQINYIKTHEGDCITSLNFFKDANNIEHQMHSIKKGSMVYMKIVASTLFTMMYSKNLRYRDPFPACRLLN